MGKCAYGKRTAARIGSNDYYASCHHMLYPDKVGSKSQASDLRDAVLTPTPQTRIHKFARVNPLVQHKVSLKNRDSDVLY